MGGMMMRKIKLLTMILFWIILIAIVPFTSCVSSRTESQVNNSTPPASNSITDSSTVTNNLTSPTPTTTDTKSPTQEYYDAVQKASEQAISVTYPYLRRTIFLTKDDSAFLQILRFLKESAVQEIIYHNPKTKGPFAFPQGGYYITFNLEASSNIFFYSTGEDIRFETYDAYLTITCSQDFWQLLADAGKRELLAISNLPKPANLTGKIVFGSNRDGNNEIYSVNADGTNLTRLTDNNIPDGTPFWSPDRTKIAYVSTIRDAQQLEKLEVYVMNSDGTNHLRLTNGGGNNPAWSPDGKLIAYVSGYGSGADIYVMDINGGNKKQLTHNSSLNGNPDWSPDGSKITFFSMRDNLEGGKGVKPKIYIMNADGTDQHPITKSTQWADTMPKWSPDGKKIVFVADRDNERRKIYLINSDGTDQIRLSSDHTGEDLQPCWSPDGSKIAFASTRSGVSEIWVMNADGTNQAPLLINSPENDISDGSPSWLVLSIGHDRPPLAHPRYKNRTISSQLSDKIMNIQNMSAKGNNT
jgi:Tol biopolymer transport system component